MDTATCAQILDKAVCISHNADILIPINRQEVDLYSRVGIKPWPLVDYSVVKILDISLVSKSTLSFVGSFFRPQRLTTIHVINPSILLPAMGK